MSDSVRPHRRQPTRPHHPWDSPGKNTSGLPFPPPMRESEVAQSCSTLSNPMDCSPPGSSIHGSFQARVLEWGAIAFSHKKSEEPYKSHLCGDSLKDKVEKSWQHQAYQRSGCAAETILSQDQETGVSKQENLKDCR